MKTRELNKTLADVENELLRRSHGLDDVAPISVARLRHDRMTADEPVEEPEDQEEE